MMGADSDYHDSHPASYFYNTFFTRFHIFISLI